MEQQDFFLKGISPSVKFAIFSLLSLLLLLVDSHYRVLNIVRDVVTVGLRPLQTIATAPVTATRWVSDFVELQSNLLKENGRLQRQVLADNSQLLRMQSLQHENAELKQLFASSQIMARPPLYGEVLYGGKDPFTRKIIINRGSNHGVGLGQIAVDSQGVLGQVTRVLPLVSEVTLVTDRNHTVPVRVQRTRQRGVVVGTGQSDVLEMRFMPVNVDIKPGDILESSSVGGIYPEGLPVARVLKIDHPGSLMFARIYCAPIGNVDKNRYLLILREEQAMPSRPEEPVVKESKSRRGKRGVND
ncbi:MAG: rod shape-determining protein MreC [Chitinivorax sp.]